METAISQSLLNSLSVLCFISASIGQYAVVIDRADNTLDALTRVYENNEAMPLRKINYAPHNVCDGCFTSSAIIGTAQVQYSTLKMRGAVLLFIHYCKVETGQQAQMVRGSRYGRRSSDALKRFSLTITFRYFLLRRYQAAQEKCNIASKSRFVNVSFI